MGDSDEPWYSLNIDFSFVVALAKIGEVHMCAAQVTVRGEDLDFLRVDIPQCARLEWVQVIEGTKEVKACFGFDHFEGSKGGCDD